MPPINWPDCWSYLVNTSPNLSPCPDCKSSLEQSLMATTRLRRAFRYPEDSGDEEHEREELDEEGLYAMVSF